MAKSFLYKCIIILFVIALVLSVSVIIIQKHNQPLFRLSITSDNNLPLIGFIKDGGKYHFAFHGFRQAFVFELKQDGTFHIINGLRRSDGKLNGLFYFIKQTEHVKIQLNQQQIEELSSLASSTFENGSTVIPGNVFGEVKYVYLLYNGKIITLLHGEINELLQKCESYSSLPIEFEVQYT